jgi:hypothetical protein
MNRYRTNGAPALPATRRLSIPESRGCKITLILLHIFVTSGAVYQPLTVIGKDCSRIG